jgi:alkanesulfonate monooxygenase SsuD/methylene tetrahydromethanopterin reductase-like flavin-dependent oxidoreductase (luciferase family)
VKKEKTMRFGLLQEAETEIGSTHYFRYRELVREVQRAEEMGFDYWGTSEQHFVSPLATVTAPEVLYGAIAAQTHTINIRHMVTLLPFAFNHPLRVAERMATLDIVSNGRAQLGCGRANHLWQLDAFQIKATETRAQMLEAMEVIDKALRLDEFEHEGPLLKIPKRRLSPRPVQHPRPPMYVIATSTESHQIAGERGHGVISCDNWLGWDHLREQAGIYTSTLSKAKPASGIINDSLGACALTGYCAETWEEAAKIGGPIAFSFLNGVLESLYLPLSKASKDYAYFGRIADELDELRHSGDAKALNDHTPTVILGTPDQVIEKIKRIEKMGYDEVVLRIDGMGHRKLMNSLELMGKYVIPEFKRPNSVVRELSIEGRVG